MKLKLVNGGTQGSEIELSDATFGREFNEPLVHQVLTAYAAAGRAGTKAQLTKSEVRGGGKKPWRQKGTGQAILRECLHASFSSSMRSAPTVASTFG